jgi:AAA+ ATPase superfamily predicted ATPase
MARDIEEVFTPSVPIEDPLLLFGRQDEMAQLDDVLKDRGAVPVIVGPRGVGKTSLAHVYLREKRRAIITCSRTSTFDDLARRLLWDLGIDVYVRERSRETEGEASGAAEISPLWRFVKLQAAAKVRGKTITHRVELGARQIVKDALVEMLCSFTDRFFVVFDEFDRLSSRTVREQVGDLLKDLADNEASHKCKVVVSGVGGSAKDLFHGHPSIPRQLREMLIKPLGRATIRAFLEKAADLLELEFAPDVLDTIVRETDGFPYAIHIVGAESCRAARRRQSRYVTMQDLEAGRQRAISYAYHDYLERYREKIDTLSLSDIRILKHMNLSRARTISLSDLRAQMRAEDALEAGEFETSWDRITRGCGLIYEHPSHPGQFLFTDPLLRPFLRLQFGYPYRKKPVAPDHPDQMRLDEFGSTDQLVEDEEEKRRDPPPLAQ